MLDGAAVLTVGCALALFAGFCVAVIRAFFTRTPSRARFRMAMLWAALLACGACGGVFVDSALGDGASAAFSVAIVCVAVALSAVLSRFWETLDVQAAVAYLQMRGVAAGGKDSPAQEGSASGMRVGNHFAAEKDAGCEAVAQTPADVRTDAALQTPADVRTDAALQTPADVGTDGALQTPVDVRTDAALRMRADAGTGGAAGFEAVCAMTARAYDLTRREEEVLQLLIGGKSFAAIAGELFVSVNTVKTHVRHIYRKMGVNRKEDLSEKVFGARFSSD